MKHSTLSKSILSIAMISAASLALVSCDTDDPYYDDWYGDYDWYDNSYDYNNWNGSNTDELAEEAATLCHPWTGTVVYRYYDNNGKQQAEKMYVDILFDRYDSKSVNGTGQETDSDGNGNTQTLKFTWYVDPKTENIYIKYTVSGYIYYFDANRTDEYGFQLNSNVFSGYAGGSNVDESLDFELTRASLSAKQSAGAKSTATTTTKARNASVPIKFVKR